MSMNACNPGSPNYADLSRLEDYRHPANRTFEFELSWPGTKLPSQHWLQRSNPYDHSGAVVGYSAISCPHSDKNWNGLRSGDSDALLCGSKAGNWYYAIGSYN